MSDDVAARAKQVVDEFTHRQYESGDTFSHIVNLGQLHRLIMDALRAERQAVWNEAVPRRRRRTCEHVISRLAATQANP